MRSASRLDRGGIRNASVLHWEKRSQRFSVDKLSRKELKTDHFAEAVGHTLEELGQRRALVTRMAVIGLVVVLLIVAGVSYFRYRAAERAEELHALFRLLESPIQEAGVSGSRVFATETERDAAVAKKADEIVTAYPGSNEAAMAQYFLATNLVESGDLNKALETLESAVKAGDSDTRGLVNFTKAQVLRALGKNEEAETTLRAVVANPGGMVAADQATLALAEILAEGKPDEAIKLLEPLRTHDGSVQQLASKLISEIRARQERASAN